MSVFIQPHTDFPTNSQPTAAAAADNPWTDAAGNIYRPAADDFHRAADIRWRPSAGDLDLSTQQPLHYHHAGW